MAETLDVCAEFELAQVIQRQAVATPRDRGVVHRRQTWDGELSRYTLLWNNANDARVTRLREVWSKSLFGSLYINWAPPPGTTAATFRIVDQSLRIVQVSANTYTASLELEEVA